MRLPEKAAVVIIGGGVSGCAIAWNLAVRGQRDVVLLEKRTLASGATGRCGAGIRMQWGAERNCRLAKLSTEFFEEGNEILGYDRDIEFKQGGYLIVAGNEKETKQFRENVKLQNQLGIPSVYLSPKEAKEIIPHMDESKILGATFCQRDGHLNPFHTTDAFAKAAERLGVKIFRRTEVLAMEREGDRVEAVVTNRGRIACETVVNAAGGWSKSVAALASVDLPVYSERHQILVTEPVEAMQEPMYMGFSLNIYIQQVPHGSFVMGRGDPNEPRDLRMSSSWQFLEEMARSCAELLPPLAKLRVLRQWAGLYNMTEDAQPIYGKASGLDNFYIAAGFSGHGFMLAPATGRLTAEMILGEECCIDVANLDMGRFARRELQFESSVV